MFRIKICGITNIADALAASDAGADAIGLNFYPKSSRYVQLDTARVLVDGVRPDLIRVGVFVNSDAGEIHQVIQEVGSAGVGLHAVQLHGDEPAALLAQLRVKYIVRARRFTNRGIAEIAQDIENCDKLRRVPDAVLIDAAMPGKYGGTGTTVSWPGLADYVRWLHNVPLILAGGLTPDNVAEAIRIVRPYGVDVASGVETSPGKKDAIKVRLIAAARGAFEGK